MTSINSNSEAAQSTTLAKQQAHARRLALDEQRFAVEKAELVLKRKAAREHLQFERKREKRTCKSPTGQHQAHNKRLACGHGNVCCARCKVPNTGDGNGD